MMLVLHLGREMRQMDRIKPSNPVDVSIPS